MPPRPPELPDELLGEAFVRLPPDDPACLLRASLTCKRWRRVLADPAFRRRHREFHRTPSVLGFVVPSNKVLGFLRTTGGDTPYASQFVPDNPASGLLAARDLTGRLVLDCRHGRVLFISPSPSLGTELNYDFVVWDPLRNEQRCVPRLPPTGVSSRHFNFNAAVLRSATMEGCDHSVCHGGPFHVAFIWIHGGQLHARVYSSETDNWSEVISVQKPPEQYSFLRMMPCPTTLVGDTLYFHYSRRYALEYQLGAQRLSIIEGPPRLVSQSSAFFVMPTGDGGLGCLNMEKDKSSRRIRLQLWSREAASDSEEVAQWTRGRAIDLEELLPNGALPSPWLPSGHPRFRSVSLLGFLESTDVIFVGTGGHNHPRAVYMVQFNSGRARKVFDKCNIVFPYTSFCIPVIDASSTTEGPGDNAPGP